ncbi:glucose 1-dehydrogenase [SAR202 cluster bacterium AD-804-J14_MRT_500m]|nr:glucose 1-dehydrogenase [SAR202 cluster bacterium AD-804-J14_MRT_500m]
MRLDGKVAIISGATRGMGEAQAKLFAAEGCKVIIGGRSERDGNRVESEIRAAGGNCIFVSLEVTKASDWRNAIDNAIRHYDKLDILVNNAGIIDRTSLEDTTEEAWDSVMNVNATGVFLGTKMAIPEMRKIGGGSIVNISSVSGILALGFPSYNASKGAIRIFTKNIAVEYAKDNIRVNSIHPGVIDTSMTNVGGQAEKSENIQAVPMGRIGSPEEVAYGALFLASDESSYMTGAEMVIDGGFMVV